MLELDGDGGVLISPHCEAWRTVGAAVLGQGFLGGLGGVL